MMRRSFASALAVTLAALVAIMQHGTESVQAGSAFTFVCPNCNLDTPAKYRCSTGGFSPGATRRLCTECPPGLFSCNNDVPSLSLSLGCQNLTNNPLNCGTCGNLCKGDKPQCVGTTCGCSSSSACGFGSFCNVGSSQCQACPAPKANCNALDNSGGEGDCETNLSNDADNCGECGKQCGTDETCSDGKCVCGDTGGPCAFPSICNGGQCVDCLATSDVVCNKRNVFDASGFCNPTTKKCEACAEGFADCSPLKTGGTPDDGTTADCETNIAPTGVSNNCGACGANCGNTGNDAQTCCSGACKCGSFVDNASPTADECAAATQCSTTEYCDEQLQMCLPLLPGNEVCNRNADSPLDDDNSGLVDTCGNCNRTLGLANFVNNTCQAFNDDACGGNGEECRTGQRCFRGKCVCDTSSSVFLTWTDFLDQDPDRDNKLGPGGRPATNCDTTLFTSVSGFLERVRQTVFRFTDCINLANSGLPTAVTSITPESFADPGFRGLVCPGGQGKCPAAFCNELFKNLTDVEKGPFCSSAERAASEMKRCSIDFRRDGVGSGDLTCANVLMRQILSGDLQTFGFIEAFNFLGCREARPNMTVTFSGQMPSSFPFRMETGKLLLGGASSLQVSAMLISAVLAISMLFVVAF